MDIRERAEKDINKLKSIIKVFSELGLNNKYQESFKWAENYLADSQYYFSKADYFSSFGCANYAYGIIDGLLIAENSMDKSIKIFDEYHQKGKKDGTT